MNIRKRIHRHKVKALTDPSPRFVSLVNHGANQTPFNAVKLAKIGDSDMALKSKKKSADLPVKKLASDIIPLVDRVTFSKKAFKTSDAVEKWLTSNEWENFSVSSKIGIFEARSDAQEDVTLEDIRSIVLDEGVTAYVGKVVKTAEDTEDTADDTDTASDDKETSEKFDLWSAYLSGSDNLKDVIKDGMRDGLPPAIDIIMFSTEKAIGNILKNADLSDEDLKTKLQGTGSELAEIVFNLHKVFSTFTGEDKDEESNKILRTAKEAWDDSVDRAVSSTERDVSIPNDKFQKLISEKVAESVTDSVTKLLAPVVKKIDDISNTVSEKVDSQDKAIDETKKQLKSLETVYTSYRKSIEDADVAESDDGDNVSDEESRKSNEFALRAFRDTFGL